MEYSQEQVASSSDEEEDEVKELETGGSSKRSYECTFCKRGFTNAQALGGHMNIHRKDRAKAKQMATPTSAPMMMASEDCIYGMNQPRYNRISNDHHHHRPSSRPYPVFESQRNYLMNYQQQPSGSSPSANPNPFHLPSQSFSTNEETLGANLSLGLGPACVDHDSEVMRRGFVEEAGLDLELRLGRNR